jgi:putative aldouronate transport system substrate-binding protein
MKRPVSPLLAAALLAALAIGAYAGEPVSPAGQFPIVKNKVTLTAFLAGYDSKLDFNENYFFKLMEDKTNVHIDVTVAVKGEDAETKKTLVLASGDYPDIFLLDNYSGITFAQALVYGTKEKILIPINKLYDAYGDELKKAWQARPEYKKLVTAPDGNIYGFQQITEAPHIYADPKLFVNTEWMKKLGMKMPETLDEFRAMLRAFKQKDPGGVGANNVIPMSSHTLCMFGTAVMESFIATDMLLCPNQGTAMIGKFIAGRNGKIVFSADKPEFKAALKYLRDLYKEGLMDPAGFTNNYDQAVKLSSTRRVGVFEVQNLWCLATSDPYVYSTYRVMPVFKGPTGQRNQATLPPIDWQNKFYAAITDKCKNPEAAYRWMDQCFNEQMLTYKWWGREGVSWRKPAKGDKNIMGGDLSVFQLTSPKDVDVSNDSMHSGPQNGIWDIVVKYRPTVSDDLLYSDPAYCESRSYLDTRNYLEKYLYDAVPSDMFTTEKESVELGKIRTDLCQYIAKAYVEFITGIRNVDTGWNAYVADLKKFRADRYVELYQKAYTQYLNAK